jgi:hypothetical protein
MDKVPELSEIINILRTQPQTYKTLLKEKFDNRNTITNLLRNKFGIWVKFHFVSASVLPGTRFGMKIFYYNEKGYFIVSTRTKGNFNYHYCINILENDDDTLILIGCNTLNDCNWVNIGDLKIERSELVKWI